MSLAGKGYTTPLPCLLQLVLPPGHGAEQLALPPKENLEGGLPYPAWQQLHEQQLHQKLLWKLHQGLHQQLQQRCPELCQLTCAGCHGALASPLQHFLTNCIFGATNCARGVISIAGVACQSAWPSLGAEHLQPLLLTRPGLLPITSLIGGAAAGLAPPYDACSGATNQACYGQQARSGQQQWLQVFGTQAAGVRGDEAFGG